ncbi:MAG: DUF3025 domain-containing protein [Burkholderiales bacterium]|nr:DUF3025 domain-containing protein [Burkholderiales bacterium]
MQTDFFVGIDWDRPWLQPYRSTAESILQAPNWRDAINVMAVARELRNHRGLPIRFVPQSELPQGLAYEAFISATSCVPTRENLHDFFNALAWLTFPQIKQQLNAIQAAEIEKAGGMSVRGRVRDAATIFDENTALLMTSDRDWLAALRAHRWQDALFASRSAFGRTVDVVLFGHALLEKLVAPYKAITAHAWLIPAEAPYFSLSSRDRLHWLDVAGAAQLRYGVTTADFTPLPVLGVPAWTTGQDAAFYADTAVFRPKRV